MKKYLNLSLKIIVSLVLLTIVFYGNLDQINQIPNIISNSNLALVFIAIGLVVINYVFSSLRWYYLLLGNRPSMGYMLRLYFVGSFFNNFLPTSIGGDAYKIYKLGEKISSKTDAFTATFLERFIGMFVLVVISLIGYLTFSGVEILSFIFVFLLGLLSFILFMVFYPKFNFRPEKFLKIFDILDKIHSSFLRYRHQKKLLFYSILLSIVVQFCSIFTQYFIFKALMIDLPLNYSFFAFPLIFLAGYAIPSINSIGSQEWLYSTFFITPLGIDKEIVLSASILYHIVRLIVSLFGAYFYVNNKEYVKK